MVTLIGGHDSSENFFFPCMIIACGFLTFDFEVFRHLNLWDYNKSKAQFTLNYRIIKHF